MPSYTAVSTFVPDVSLRAKLPQLARDRIRGDYGAVVGERFMVGFNEAQVVEIVDHEPGGFAHPLDRGVAEEVQPLQASAAAKMEWGKRVERLEAAFRTQGVEECIDVLGSPVHCVTGALSGPRLYSACARM